MQTSEFYLIPEDVYRLGNSDSSRLGHVRSRDVDATVVNGITVVIANGKGISVFDLDAITHAPFEGWVWKLPASTALPNGLKMVNDKPGHYCIAPTVNMPVDKYKGLLEELGLKAQRVVKKQGKVAL
jgi:hypothetical protein